jgi:hypothetical protein
MYRRYVSPKSPAANGDTYLRYMSPPVQRLKIPLSFAFNPGFFPAAGASLAMA